MTKILALNKNKLIYNKIMQGGLQQYMKNLQFQ